MSSFRNLPPELLSLILRNLNSPRDLHSLISASPSCLHAFLGNKYRILLWLCVKGIQPGALRDALALHHAPRRTVAHGRMGLRCNEGVEPTDSEPFLSKYFSDATFEPPTDMADLTELLRLQSLVSRFAHGYFKEATALLGAPLAPSDPTIIGEVAPPSPTEWTRLQRAFFRYELYCRAFPSDKKPLYQCTHARDQCELFMDRLKPWEVEEITCVHNYLTRQVGSVVDAVEDLVVMEVLTADGARRMPSVDPSRWRRPNRRGSQVASGWYNFPPSMTSTADAAAAVGGTNATGEALATYLNELVPFGDLVPYGLGLFSDITQEDIPCFISNVSSCGLEYVQRLLDASDERQVQMVQEHAFLDREFLGEALRYSVSRRGLFARPRREKVINDDPNAANTGYSLFRRREDISNAMFSDSEAIIHDPLREMGYAFWDFDRIKAERPRLNLERAREVPDEEISSKRLRRNVLSVQTRLRGVVLPRAELTKIADMFAYRGWVGDEDEEEDEYEDE